MSNEATILNEPTSVPQAVSTGYQRQNVNLAAQRNGLDKSVVVGGVGKVTVKVSGPVDVNGVLYTISTEVDLTIVGGAGRYVIYLSGSGDALTPTLTDTAPEFDEEKNAHYTSGGYRVLNWLITYDGTTAIARRFEDRCEDTWITSDAQDWTAMVSKVYEIWMVGRGGAGGDATSTDGTNATGGCGGGGCTGVRKIFINAGDTWTSSFSTASGGDTQFSDGSTTLTVENGFDGYDATDGSSFNGGSGGRELGSSGLDKYMDGQVGGWAQYGFGGDSVMGVGGCNGFIMGGLASNFDGQQGRKYGGGGGGAYRDTIGTSSGGSGGSAAIHIVG